MANLEIQSDEIAKRYGGVLFALAQEKKQEKPILKEIGLLQKSLNTDGLSWARIMSPVLPLQTQRTIIQKVASKLKLSPLMTHFLLVLCKNRRLSNLANILVNTLGQAETAEGLVKGEIQTAQKLTQNEQQDLEKSLEKKLGKKVSLTQVIKEELIAGVFLRMGSLMIDASLSAQLNRLRLQMKG